MRENIEPNADVVGVFLSYEPVVTLVRLQVSSSNGKNHLFFGRAWKHGIDGLVRSRTELGSRVYLNQASYAAYVSEEACSRMHAIQDDTTLEKSNFHVNSN